MLEQLLENRRKAQMVRVVRSFGWSNSRPISIPGPNVFGVDKRPDEGLRRGPRW